MTEPRESQVAGAAAPKPEPPKSTNGVPTSSPENRNAPGQPKGRSKYSRVLLKLGGEMFGGGQVGLDPDVVAQVARQIAEVVRGGVQVAVVIGGGNFFRGAQLQQRGMERTRSDYMGMLGTVMNSLALQDFLEKEGIATRVQTAITMGQVAEPLTAISHREVIDRGLRVADATAFSLCMDNGMPILVFNLLTNGNIARAVAGEKIGTLVTT